MNVLDLIGHTPLIELDGCSPSSSVRLFAKLEGQNPTGSIKDRLVAFMIKRATEDGRLRPGQEIVDRRRVIANRNWVPGAYVVTVGIYDRATGDRYPAFSAAGQPLPDGALKVFRWIIE